MMLVIQSGQTFDQRGGGGLFAPGCAFLLIVNGDGLRHAVLMLGQREQADVVADILPSIARLCGNVPARASNH